MKRDTRLRGKRWLAALTVALGAALGSWAAVAVPDVVRIPRANPESQLPLPNAQFSHRRHSQYQCYACHPSLFPQAPLGFTHDDMDAGRFCGHCHDNETAPAPKQYACEVCHAR